MTIEELIKLVVKDPSEDNKNQYEHYVSQLEYDLILDNNLKEAYAVRGKCATQLIREWVKVYGTTEGCPASYQDTLNIPFRLEKNKHLKS